MGAPDIIDDKDRDEQHENEHIQPVRVEPLGSGNERSGDLGIEIALGRFPERKLHLSENIKIEIYDINGRVVNSWTRGFVDSWDRGLADSGVRGMDGGNDSQTYNWTPDENLGSGVYLVRAKAGKEVITKKVIYLK